MKEAVLRLGDQVTFMFRDEDERAPWRAIPDGAVGHVIDFGRDYVARIDGIGRRPGEYLLPVAATVRLDDGTDHFINIKYLEMVDVVEYQRRVAALPADLPVAHWKKCDDHLYLGPLPYTPVWEGDRVRVRPMRGGVLSIHGPDYDLDAPEPDILTVTKIDWHWLKRRRDDGSPYPAYCVGDRLAGSWHRSAAADDITLVERGNVWRHFHGEPCVFDSLKDEAHFFKLLGHVEDVVNQASGHYSFSKEEALAAIREGHGDAIEVSSFFGSKPMISVSRFHDRDLGRRVAALTLEGFAAG